MVERLGWTLVHFVWEGCAVAVVLALLLFLTRAASANVRYGLACGALLLLAVLPVTTYLTLTPVPVSAGIRGGTTWTAGEAILGAGRSADGRMPLLVQVWAVGVIALSLRLAGTLVQVERWRHRHTRPADAAWQDRLDALARRLGVGRPVRFLVSDTIGVPSAWGVLRPLVVLPASLLSGLPSEQVESILLHELAHVRRHDYLVNLAQTVVETVLFYHPAVWWVSAVVRREREHCCDDAVVVALGDPMPYARALLHLEERRQILPRPTLSAKEGKLMNRIARILGAKPAPVRLSPLAPVLAALGVVVLVSGGALQANAQTLKNPAPAKIAPKKPVAKAKPKKAAITVVPKASPRPVPTLRLAPLTKPTLLAKPATKTVVAIVTDPNGRVRALDTAAPAKAEFWSYPTRITQKTATVTALAATPQKGVASTSPASAIPAQYGSTVTITRNGAMATQGATRSLGSIQGGKNGTVGAPLAATGQLGGLGGQNGGFGGFGGGAQTSGGFGGLGGGVFGSGQGVTIRGLGNKGLDGLSGGALGSQNRAFGSLGGGFGAAIVPPGNLKAMMDAIVVETRTAGRVSVDVDHAPFAMTLRKLAKQTGLSVVIGKGTYDDLTMVLNDLPIERAMTILCREAGADFRQEAGVWYVTPEGK